MDGIGTIFSVIALFVSVTTLWFANDVIKRIDRQNQELIERHVRAVKESVDDCLSKIAKLEKRAADSDKQIGELANKDEEVAQAAAGYQAALNQLRVDLDALDTKVSNGHRNARASRRGG